MVSWMRTFFVWLAFLGFLAWYALWNQEHNLHKALFYCQRAHIERYMPRGQISYSTDHDVIQGAEYCMIDEVYWSSGRGAVGCWDYPTSLVGKTTDALFEGSI